MRTFKRIRTALESSLLQTPAIVDGRLLPDAISISKSVSCPQEDKPILSRQLYVYRDGTLNPTKMVSSVDSTVTFDEYDRDFDYRVVVRTVKEEESIIEVHREGSILYKKSLKELHGLINCKPQFSNPSLSFHPSKKQCLYLAEVKAKTANLFTDEFKQDNIRENEYKHSFGETCETDYNIGLFIVDYEKNTIYKVIGLPKDKTIVTASFLSAENKDRLLITAYDNERLISGINMCFNKPSNIYIVEDFELENLCPSEAEKKKKEESKEKVEEKLAKLTKISEFNCVHFPSSSPSGKHIVYLFSREYNESHIFTTGLAVYTQDGRTEVIVDSDEKDGKLAIYAYYDTYQKMKWLSEDEIVFSSYEKAHTVINLVNVEKKSRRIIPITKELETDNIQLLDIHNDSILFSLNNMYHRGRVGVFTSLREWFDRDRKDTDICWEVKPKVPVDSDYLIQEGEIEEVKISIRDVEGYIWRLKNQTDENGLQVPPSKRPLMIDFHGGPHWFSSAIYRSMNVVLMKQGFQVMTLNFSGSWSFGKNFNERLGGEIGKMDIKELIDWLDNNKSEYDAENVYFEGGSYSGYQSIVLYREYHKYFKGIFSINPVTNLVYALYQTDIPEWNIIEGLGRTYDITKDLTDEDILKLKSTSPAMLPFDKDTKTKLLLILGDLDRRVPPGQSLHLFKKLKALGHDVRCLRYKAQGHTIRKPKFVLDYTLNIFDIIFDFEAQEQESKKISGEEMVESPQK